MASYPPNTSQQRYYAAPIINQHTTWPDQGWRYCTVGTLYMFLKSSGVAPHLSTTPTTDGLVGVYTDNGYGSGAHMANYIREYTSLPDVEFLTTSSAQAFESQLTQGLPVPIGVWHWEGAVFDHLGRQAGESTNYDVKLGEPHPRNSGWIYPDGHWGLIVGYNDDYFFINDPDSGANIRIPKATLGNSPPKP